MVASVNVGDYSRVTVCIARSLQDSRPTASQDGAVLHGPPASTLSLLSPARAHTIRGTRLLADTGIMENLVISFKNGRTMGCLG